MDCVTVSIPAMGVVAKGQEWLVCRIADMVDATLERRLSAGTSREMSQTHPGQSLGKCQRGEAEMRVCMTVAA